MKKYLTLLLIALFLFIPNYPALAFQSDGTSTPTLAIFEVDIRPEFDDPSVLVIYHMVLSADTKLPAQITVHIPARAQKPSAVAWVDSADGSLYELKNSTVLNGDWIDVTMSTPAPEIQLEYYDPSLKKDGSVRSYQYQWDGGFEINELSINIEEPVGATDMVISPKLGSPQQGQNGVTYYYAKLGAVPLGTKFNIELQYTKSDDALSIEQLKVSSSGPLNENTSGRTTLNEVMPKLLIVIGGLLIFGLFWWLQSVKNHSPKKRPSELRHKAVIKQILDEPETAEHCHECGTKAQPGDQFCRVCGTRLRKI